MDSEPDFSSYSYEDLLDAERHINRELYPERYKKILALINDPNRKQMEANRKAEVCAVNASNKYATFWLRVFASIIDGIILTLVLVVCSFPLGLSVASPNVVMTLLGSILTVAYKTWMHGVYGQTLGKMVLGVRVVDHSAEAKISLSQALRRQSVDILISIIMVLWLYGAAIESLDDSSVQAAMFSSPAYWLSMVWGLGEIISAIVTKKRKALHDFIGGTVVVRV